jgi:hypothetical protein
MFGGIVFGIWLSAFIGIPILVIFSSRGWATTFRATLPSWRSRFGVGSLGVIFCGWLFIVVLTILGISTTLG